MPKTKKLSWKDHEDLLTYLSDHSVKQTALKFGLTEGAIRQRLYIIRRRLDEESRAINRIKKLQRVSDRIKKFTLTGTILEEEELET